MKRKIATKGFLAHEFPVKVMIGDGVHLEGYAFGSNKDHEESIIVCIPKAQWMSAGLECSGPCINKFYDASRITFLEKIPYEPSREEEEDGFREIDITGGLADSPNNLLGSNNPEKKKRKGGRKQKLVSK